MDLCLISYLWPFTFLELSLSLASLTTITSGFLPTSVNAVSLTSSYFSSLCSFFGENAPMYYSDHSAGIKHYFPSIWENCQKLAFGCQLSLDIAFVANNCFTGGHTSTTESLQPNPDQHRGLEALEPQV